MLELREITNLNIWKVWLLYEPENTHARDMFRKYGFVENGEMCGNEMVAVYEL